MGIDGRGFDSGFENLGLRGAPAQAKQAGTGRNGESRRRPDGGLDFGGFTSVIMVVTVCDW